MIVFSSVMNIGLFISSEVGRKTTKLFVVHCKMLDCPFLHKYPYIVGCCYCNMNSNNEGSFIKDYTLQ